MIRRQDKMTETGDTIASPSPRAGTFEALRVQLAAKQ